MDNPFKSPAILSFCPGLLGLERGIIRAIGSIRVMAYVEIEAFIIANLVAGMEAGILDPAPIWTNAKTFDARPFRGRVHGIIGGYPCTPFSLAGKRTGENHAGHIWPNIREAIKTAQPLWCFFENVDDHLSLGFDTVLKDLQALGYYVEAGVFSAEECGASIEAQRLFILALAKTNSSSTIRGLDNLLRTRQENEDTAQGKNWKWRGDESSNSGEALDKAAKPRRKARPKLQSGERTNLQLSECPGKAVGFAHSLRFVRSIGNELQEDFGENESSKRSKVIRAITKDFPIGQGIYQWQWEEPRQIESCVGYTIERYNFTEDLLRANGNMVPEQQAELAFRTLLEKFINQHETKDKKTA